MSRPPTGNTVSNTLFLHVNLAGRPYCFPHFRGGLPAVVNLNDITGVGQCQMGHVWMVTCANTVTNEKLTALKELRVKD